MSDTPELTKIIGILDGIRDGLVDIRDCLTTINEPSRDVAADRNGAFKPAPKFAPSDKVIRPDAPERGVGEILRYVDGLSVHAYDIAWSNGTTLTGEPQLEPAPNPPTFQPGQRVRVVRDTYARWSTGLYQEGETLFVQQQYKDVPADRTHVDRRPDHCGNYILTADLELIPEAANDDTEEMLNESADIMFFKLDAEEAANDPKEQIAEEDVETLLRASARPSEAAKAIVAIVRRVDDPNPDREPERTPEVVAITVRPIPGYTRGESEYAWGGFGRKFNKVANRSIPIGWTWAAKDGEVVLRGPRNEILTARDVYEKEEWSVTG